MDTNKEFAGEEAAILELDGVIELMKNDTSIPRQQRRAMVRYFEKLNQKRKKRRGK